MNPAIMMGDNGFGGGDTGCDSCSIGGTCSDEEGFVDVSNCGDVSHSFLEIIGLYISAGLVVVFLMGLCLIKSSKSLSPLSCSESDMEQTGGS